MTDDLIARLEKTKEHIERNIEELVLKQWPDELREDADAIGAALAALRVDRRTIRNMVIAAENLVAQIAELKAAAKAVRP